jgi:hypothetical protein
MPISTLEIPQSPSNPAVVVENSGPTGGVIKIITLVLSNKNSNQSAATVLVKRQSESYKIINGVKIASGKSVSVFNAKDVGIYLEVGDSVLVSSDSANVEAICSYEG